MDAAVNTVSGIAVIAILSVLIVASALAIGAALWFVVIRPFGDWAALAVYDHRRRRRAR